MQRIIFIVKVNLIFCICLILFGCSNEKGKEFVGKWINTRAAFDTLEITRNGEQFLVVEHGSKFGAIYKDGTLEIATGFGLMRITYDRSSDMLTAPGIQRPQEYKRINSNEANSNSNSEAVQHAKGNSNNAVKTKTDEANENAFYNKFIRVHNRWKNDQYLNIERGILESSPIAMQWWSAQWIFEPAEDKSYCRIRNKWKNDQYLNIEKGGLVSSPINMAWWSAQWNVEPIAGTQFVRIRNRWKSDQCLNIENGQIQSSRVESDWWSAQWTLDPVDR